MAMAICVPGGTSALAHHIAALTPRVKPTRLSIDSAMTGTAIPAVAGRNGSMQKEKEDVSAGGTTARAAEDGVIVRSGTDGPVVRTSLDGVSDSDGRMTPVPRVDATIRRNVAQTPRSGNLHSSQYPSSASTSASHPPSGPAMLTLAPATAGLGSLAGEDQLRVSLNSKDRMFVVMLSNEIEAFIQRVVAGETPEEAQAARASVGGASLLVFGQSPSVRLQSQSASKFQKMLVYKAAEWYGIKAASLPDNTMFIGVQGVLPEKSASLKLALLVPERETVQQKFQIMQRSQAGNSRSPAPSEGGQGGPSSRKTLEQREAEYAAERERIYGSGQPADSLATGIDSAPPVAAPVTHQAEDEIDPVSRYAYGAAAMAVYEPVYASLYHPPKPDAPSVELNDGQASMQGGYYVNPAISYPTYQMMSPYPSAGNGYNTGIPAAQAMYITQQAYDQNGNPIMLVPQHQQAFGTPTWHPHMGGQPGMVPQPAMQPMVQPGQPVGNGWAYSSHQIQPGGVQPMMAPPNAGMPGTLQPVPYGYSAYPSLMHPQPHRPQLQSQQHSSASSSISSQSYQSYSRPHSRGSTTSTRSAASSVRFGQMYPSQQYRQKGMKGVNGLTTLGVGQERRNPRGQSPSSTTTTSSRSSRRTNSIALQAPSQHPLPQRPDWAANNVQYEPSTILPPPPQAAGSSSQHPASTVASPAISSGSLERSLLSSPGMTQNWTPPSPYSNGTFSQQSGPPTASIQASNVTAAPTTAGSDRRHPDEEYHRGPASIPSQALYNPTGTAMLASPSPVSVNASRQSMPIAQIAAQALNHSADTATMSPEDLIEAKLQALSMSTGVSIGPPPIRAAGSGGPSYAKIVRSE